MQVFDCQMFMAGIRFYLKNNFFAIDNMNFLNLICARIRNKGDYSC